MTPTFLLQATTLATLLLLHLFPTPSAGVIPTAYITDENGEPLLNGGTYYILRRQAGKSTGLKVSGSSCPLSITLETDESSNGLPIKISSHINSKYLPYGTTDFTFVGVAPTCTEPLVWRLSPDNNITSQHYVAVGTPQSREPSAFSLVSPFNYVEPWQYQINFCDQSLCGRVNVVEENGLLAINNDLNFAVRFRKAFDGSPLLNSVI